MKRRLFIQWLAAQRASVAAAGLSLGVLGACSENKPSFVSIDVTGADYARDFAPAGGQGGPLKDHNGQARAIKDFAGKVVVVFFGYTQCPDVCPTTMAELAEVKKLLGKDGDKLQAVFITVDPARDTPEVLRAWLDKFDPRFIGLTGDSASIAAAMGQIRLGPSIREPGETAASYTIGHSAMVLAFTRDDSAHVVYPFGVRQADWARDLPRLVTGG